MRALRFVSVQTEGASALLLPFFEHCNAAVDVTEEYRAVGATLADANYSAGCASARTYLVTTTDSSYLLTLGASQATAALQANKDKHINGVPPVVQWAAYMGMQWRDVTVSRALRELPPIALNDTLLHVPAQTGLARWMQSCSWFGVGPLAADPAVTGDDHYCTRRVIQFFVVQGR
jgi:hypothetical protein